MSSKCIVCDIKPASDGTYLCNNCRGRIQADMRRHKSEVPEKYIVHKSNVVGLFKSNGNYHPRLLRRDPEKLPQGKVLNLDNYLEGFTREQIRKLKATVKALTKV